MVGARTGITFARVSWPLRDHLDHPADLIAASRATPAIRSFSYVAFVTAVRNTPLRREQRPTSGSS
eukprot:5641466-Heterocapsa_arctica.AAC.1